MPVHPLPWRLVAHVWLDRSDPQSKATLQHSLQRWARSREQPGGLILPSDISRMLLRAGVRKRQLLHPADPIGGRADRRPRCSAIDLKIHRL